MSDGQGTQAGGTLAGGEAQGGGAAAAAIAAAAAGAAAGGAGAGGGEGQQREASWQAKFLPADMQGNEALARYGSIPDMAKGLIETQAWARGRVAVPGAADATAFEEFAAKVRPAEAKDYQILGPDGKTSETGEAFRATFHAIGLHPIQAQKLTEQWNQYQTDQISKITQAGRDEITAIELEMGPQGYNMRLAAVGNLLKSAGIEVADIVPALEQVGGAGKAMRALMTIAEKTGELAKVDGATIAMRMGAMTPQAAQEGLDAMSREPGMTEKLNDPNSAESLRRKGYLDVLAKARAAPR